MMSGIKYISMYEPSGYGIAAKRYMQALIHKGIDLTWSPMVKGMAWQLGYEPFIGKSIGDADLGAFCNRSINYDTTIIHTVPEYFPHWIKREKNKKIIGYTVWETDIIPAHWPALLNMVDSLVVPCQWNKSVFARAGINRPVAVVPHLYDNHDITNIDITSFNRINNIADHQYLFYTIGEWTTRKAIALTVHAYCRAFTAHDQVQLIIKTNARDLTKKYLHLFYRTTAQALKEIVRQYPLAPPIKLISSVISEQDILALHARGDCYISLCHGEGWGIGAYDAAKFAKPVIITGYGGQCDYLPADHAFLVNYKLIPVIDKLRARSYDVRQSWAEPDLDHAVQLMRDVYQQREMAINRGQALKDFLITNFNEQIITDKFIALINGYNS